MRRRYRAGTVRVVTTGTLPPVRRFIAEGFGVGRLPRRWRGSDAGAGTLGALVAVAIGVALLPAPWWTDGLVAIVAIGVSLWAAAPYAMDDDPGWVTIDEVAGTLVAMIGLGGAAWVVAVVIARLGDIFKVLPGVRWADRRHGALAVTLDDVVAGLYGLAAGWLMVALT